MGIPKIKPLISMADPSVADDINSTLGDDEHREQIQKYIAGGNRTRPQ